MGRMTFVVEFEDGKEPLVSADMYVAGGRVVAASWSDYRDDYFTDEHVDFITAALEDFNWNGEISDEDTTAILDKIELLTL